MKDKEKYSNGHPYKCECGGKIIYENYEGVCEKCGRKLTF